MVSKPIDHSFLPQLTLAKLVHAHDELKAKRKLTLMLRSKVTRDSVVELGDLVQVFVKEGKDKRGKRLSTRVVLSVDNDFGIVSVLGSSGRPISAAAEDVRIAIVDDELAVCISETNDQLDRILGEAIKYLPEANVNVSSEVNVYAPDFDHNGGTIADPFIAVPNFGDRLNVFWPLDDQYYFGVVSSVTGDGQRVIQYEGGDSKTLDM